MVIKEVLKKYLQLIDTEDFAKYKKDFACKIQKGLIDGYNKGSKEPELVSGVVNNLNHLSMSYNSFQIVTKSIFIHGNKSQVKFEYNFRKRNYSQKESYRTFQYEIFSV